MQKVIGLMSGTSLDGIDAALLETDGEDIARPGPGLTLPYDGETRALLRRALEGARAVADFKGEGAPPVPQFIHQAERLCTEAHARAVGALLDKAGLTPADVALIGFHGQTILHRPAQRLTWQIGDGALLARRTGIDVVNDFRSADVKAGGQGAPLVPLYHAALARTLSSAFGGGDARSSACDAKGGGGIAIVNIGGVANVTYIDGDEVLAFDTGPGNAPIDDWMLRHAGRPVDEGGAFAAQGCIDRAALDAMLAHPFFARRPPKSLDRLDFGTAAVAALAPADGAATLAAFTAAAIARAREHFPQSPATWVICGGGRHNDFLMDQLRARVNAPVLKAEAVGWNGDCLEAEAFAYLAARSVRGLPLSLPTTTGVPVPMTGGELHKAR
jgi:anhydro-N-acetylmuramic acid kinase